MAQSPPEIAEGGAGGAGEGGAQAAGAGGTGGSSNGGAGGEGGQAPRCGGLGAFVDDFEDLLARPIWESVPTPDVTVEQVGGRVVLTSAGAGTGRFRSKVKVDARDRLLVMELSPPSSTAIGRLKLTRDDAHAIAIEADGSTLRATRTVGGNTDSFPIAYDPAQHRHLMLENMGGETFWRASPDGAQWTTVHSEPTDGLFDMDLVFVALEGVFDATPAAVEIEALTGFVEPFCEVSSFTDAFDDMVVHPFWERGVEQGGCGRFEEDALRFEFVGVPTERCSYETITYFDLSGDSVSIEYVTPHPGPPQRVAELIVGVDRDNHFLLSHAENNLFGNIRTDGGSITVFTTPFDAALHRFWRIAEANGFVVWETSVDGVRWETQGSRPTTFSVEAVATTIVGYPNQGSGAYTLELDNYNLQ